MVVLYVLILLHVHHVDRGYIWMVMELVRRVGLGWRAVRLLWLRAVRRVTLCWVVFVRVVLIIVRIVRILQPAANVRQAISSNLQPFNAYLVPQTAQSAPTKILAHPATKTMKSNQEHVSTKIVCQFLLFVRSARLEYVYNVLKGNILMKMGDAIKVLVCCVWRLRVLIILTAKLVIMGAHFSPNHKQIYSVAYN